MAQALTGRDKLEAAFSKSGAEALPVVIPYEGIFIRDHWAQVTKQPWWHMHSPDLAHQVAWRRDFFNSVGQDWFELPYCPAAADRHELRIEERPDGVYMMNIRSKNEWKLEPPVTSGESIAFGNIAASAHSLDSIEDIDALLPSPPQPYDPWTDGSADLAKLLLEGEGRELMPFGDVTAPLWASLTRLGYQGAMEKLAEDLDLIDYACKRMTEMAKADAQQAAALGCRMIWIEDCWTDMVSAKAFKELNVRYLREITEEIRSHKMLSIHYFCGNPKEKLDLLLQTGADALSLEESKKGFKIDIDEVADRVRGRVVLLGNLDALGLLEHGSERDLRREIERQVAAGRRNQNRFVVSLGSPVTPGTSAQRVKLYCDLARELGKGS